MNTVLLTKKLYAKACGYFPTELPVGMQAFDDFCTDILSIYELPDNPSYRHAIATRIMHLGPQTYKVSKHQFAATIKKAMANQVAFEKIQRLKELEKEYAKQIEETATKLKGSDESEAKGTAISLVPNT